MFYSALDLSLKECPFPERVISWIKAGARADSVSGKLGQRSTLLSEFWAMQPGPGSLVDKTLAYYYPEQTERDKEEEKAAESHCRRASLDPQWIPAVSTRFFSLIILPQPCHMVVSIHVMFKIFFLPLCEAMPRISL